MANYKLGPVIGKIGGGRESQEITLTNTDQTITMGEGRWLLTLTATSNIYFDNAYMGSHWREFEGPATHRIRSAGGSPTAYITPLTD